jgi:hypothetical protein
MRTSYEQQTGSATPIYDSLYDEYRRLFRALPGDRTGEEELRFTGFSPAHGGGGATVGGAGGWQVYIRHPQASASVSASAAASPYSGHAHLGYVGYYGYGGQSRALPAALPPAR